MIIVKSTMNNKNRINRLSFLLHRLSVGYGLSTPNLVECILPLFDDGAVFYDYSLKIYTAKSNFLATTLFTAQNQMKLLMKF